MSTADIVPPAGRSIASPNRSELSGETSIERDVLDPGDEQVVSYLRDALQCLNWPSNAITGERSYAAWIQWRRALVQAFHHRAAEVNAVTEIAEECETAQQFWNLVSNVDAGVSSTTYWDTYEHGRRRQLERRLAQCYGAATALLLNCGMSAIAVSLGSCCLRSGDVLLTGTRRYFETTGYIDRFVRPSGVQVIEVEVGRPGALVEALTRFRPRVVLVETATNAPSVDCPKDINLWAQTSPDTIFIIDNSIQSVLTRWYDIAHDLSDRLLVVESGTKFITNEIMCGVVYGAGEPAARARNFARDTGQQLQGRSLSYLNEHLLDLLPRRLAIHDRNTRRFAEILRQHLPTSFHVVTVDSDAPAIGVSPFDLGIGCLVFVVGPSCLRPEGYHRILSSWRSLCGREVDHAVPSVRAGFGWLGTAARVYQGSLLNQSDAPSYLRISVGAEPEFAIKASARALATAISELATNT
jgi:cystathionine beta-lyase/cystathionine gamma-synthase